MTTTLPAGFEFSRNWTCGACPFETLERELAWTQPTLTLYGRQVRVPRLTASMGAAYSYSGTTHEPAPWHPLVSALCDRLALKTGAAFNSCLVNLYRDGQDSIAWHADDEPKLGSEPTIASVSLGGARRFSIKRRTTGAVWNLKLADGDLLVMSGASQRDYLHSLPKTARPAAPRINLTFRTIGG